MYHFTNSFSLSHVPSHMHAPLLFQPIYAHHLILVWLLCDTGRTKMATCHRNCQASFHLSHSLTHLRLLMRRAATRGQQIAKLPRESADAHTHRSNPPTPTLHPPSGGLQLSTVEKTLALTATSSHTERRSHRGGSWQQLETARVIQTNRFAATIGGTVVTPSYK